MCTGYILQWLDTLVTVTLNPAKSPITAATADEVAKIMEQVAVEKEKIETTVKLTVFNLDDEAQIRCTVKKYHSSLIAILDQAVMNHTILSGDNILKQLSDNIISAIDELLVLIETRFIGYLGLEERVPSTYLVVAKIELSKKLLLSLKKLRNYPSFQPALDIIKGELELILKSTIDKQQYTFRQLFYLKELCRELEQLQPIEEPGIYSSLDKLLISMNFNSKAYTFSLTQRVAMHINHFEQLSEKMEQLLFDLKLFKQSHKRPDIIFNMKDADLHEQINNWFSQEMFYLEKKNNYLVHPLNAKSPTRIKGEQVKQKIRSVLSVDQLALVLRAADDTKIIIARSLNSVFQTLTPYLSTPNQNNLSYNSMRGKSYSAETRDKEIAIDALKQIINRIKEL